MKALLAIAAALLAPALHAASFDCAKASTRVEKAICASPALGKLDEDVAAAYAAARAGLDDTWRARLLRSQREWLASRVPSAQLADDLDRRLRILQGSRVSVGGVPFLRLSDDARPMYVLGNAPGAPAYNQWVDSIWLAAVGETTEIRQGTDACPSGRRDDCEADSTARAYATSVPSPGLLSVSEKVISYEQGAAHPEVDLKVHDWWLSRAGRVRLDDIFTGAGWKPVIAKAARAIVKKENDRLQVDADAIDSVATIDDWKLTATALVFTMDGYQFNLGRGLWEVEVPWKDFGASLRPEFAAALGLH